MNILFSLCPNNIKNAKTYTLVWDLLINSGHEVVVLCKKNKYIELIRKEYTIHGDIKKLKCNDFDLILTSTNSITKELKNMSSQVNIPIIGLIDSCEYAFEKIVEHNSMDKIVLLNPPLDYPEVLLLPGFNCLWRISAIFPRTSTNDQLYDPKCPRMIVAIDEKTGLLSPVFHLIPLLNRLLNFEIMLVTENKGIQKMLNSNIRIVPREKTDLLQLLMESYMVVASGWLAEQAIVLNKPVIIAGERGYGGLLSEDIFELQYQNQFQGRIGGTPGEYIPEKLLMENILDLMEWGADRINTITQTNRHLLKKKVEEQKTVLNKLLQKTVKQHEELKNNLAEVNLRSSDVWQLKLFSKGRFVLLNIATNQVHGHFEKEEANIIELFREGCHVKKALKISGYSEEPELFMDFIRNLVAEKILQIDEK